MLRFEIVPGISGQAHVNLCSGSRVTFTSEPFTTKRQVFNSILGLAKDLDAETFFKVKDFVFHKDHLRRPVWHYVKDGKLIEKYVPLKSKKEQTPTGKK